MGKILSSYENEVTDYFSSKAKGFDDVEKQQYWQLSDKLLWYLLSKLLDKMPEKFLFLDAGGGTGRWSKKILENYPKSQGVLVDFSPEMLAIAKEKNSFGDRWQILDGDIQKLDLKENTFDLVLNTHNVLGFVENSKIAISEMYRVLKYSSKLISVVPNLYHGIFFNIFQNNLNMAKELTETTRGKFVENMPKIEMFSPGKIKEMYNSCRFKEIHCYGFPIAIYPGYQETQLHGESKQNSEILSNNFEKIYELEKNLIENEETASRGNNLFIIGTKVYKNLNNPDEVGLL